MVVKWVKKTPVQRLQPCLTKQLGHLLRGLVVLLGWESSVPGLGGPNTKEHRLR